MEGMGEARARLGHMLALREVRLGRWRELARWLCPWRGGCLNDGERLDFADDESSLTLFNHVAEQALLMGASGLTSGMTPRNTPWFRPVFANPELAELAGARSWLDRLTLAMEDCLARGGFYQAIQNFNLDLLWAGCGLLYCERGSFAPLRFESVAPGAFCASLDHEGRLEAVARLIEMTHRDAAAVFGAERLSEQARGNLERKPFERLRVWQLCERAQSGRWPVTSRWWEEGGEAFLRQSGFFEMPFFFASWNEGATAYGTGPGDQCLADARQLDLLERHKLDGMAKLVRPPVIAPSQYKDNLDLAPGGINYLAGTQQIIPILDLGPYASSLRQIQEEIAVVTRRLQEGLKATIFSSMPLDQRPRDMSATEFLERKREALQQLGPVISAYEPNVLAPCLERVLATLDREGLLAPPPDELAGLPVGMGIDFISPLANALRQTGAEATRALLADVGGIFSSFGNSEILDKLDLDQAVDELASGIGAPGSIVRADEEVAGIRKARAEREQQERQAQEMAQALSLAQGAQQLMADTEQMRDAQGAGGAAGQ